MKLAKSVSGHGTNLFIWIVKCLRCCSVKGTPLGPYYVAVKKLPDETIKKEDSSCPFISFSYRNKLHLQINKFFGVLLCFYSLKEEIGLMQFSVQLKIHHSSFDGYNFLLIYDVFLITEES